MRQMPGGTGFVIRPQVHTMSAEHKYPEQLGKTKATTPYALQESSSEHKKDEIYGVQLHPTLH